MVLAAVELARRGQKVLYHHKVVPTFVKFAETIGVKWQRPGIRWFYHPAAEHKSLTW